MKRKYAVKFMWDRDSKAMPFYEDLEIVELTYEELDFASIIKKIKSLNDKYRVVSIKDIHLLGEQSAPAFAGRASAD